MTARSLRATMDRRLLVNYRVDPEVLSSILPAPFRPALVGDAGVAGICLLRLTGTRPAWSPWAWGLTTENAAHRIAVEWDTLDGVVTGVYVPRRDTSSRLAVLAGGRLFPGWQHRARFRTVEAGGRYRIDVASGDGQVAVTVDASVSDRVMPGSVFADVTQASRFFQEAPVGYSATPTAGRFDGMALGTETWAMTPLHVASVRSTFFDDPHRFPPGSAEPDSAFLMAGLSTTWSPQPPLTASDLVSRVPA